jgi:hypothetical protein
MIPGHFAQAVAGIEQLGRQRLPTGKGEQLPGQLGRAIRRRSDRIDIALSFRLAQIVPPEQVDRAADHGEQIVEIMRHAAGQLADRLHLLRLSERILRRFALAGALLHALLQLVGQPAERILGIALGGDVGVGPEPADHLAGSIAHRLNARQEGPEGPVRGAQREHHFERIALRDGSAPPFEHLRQPIRVMDRLPAPALHLLGRGAGIIVPALIVPEDRSVRPRAPAQGRDRIGQRAELPFAFPQLFQPLPRLILPATSAQRRFGKADQSGRVERPLDKGHVAEQLQIAHGARITLQPAAAMGQQHERKVGPFGLFLDPGGDRSCIAAGQRLLGHQRKAGTLLQFAPEAGKLIANP